MKNTLENKREQIDRIDEEIHKLFIKRMELADDIAQCKKEAGTDIYCPDRETEILNRAKENAGKYGKYAYRLFETILRMSREYQHERINENENT